MGVVSFQSYLFLVCKYKDRMNAMTRLRMDLLWMKRCWLVVLMLLLFLNGGCCHNNNDLHRDDDSKSDDDIDSRRCPTCLYIGETLPTATTGIPAVTNSSIGTTMILMDSIQINPGDTAIGQQQGSKYSHPKYLQQLGYTARATSMEQNPALCMTYAKADRVVALSSTSSSSSNNEGIFENDRNSSIWVKTYCQGIQRLITETTQAGLELYFFTDMIVFPKALIELYPEIIVPDESTATNNNINSSDNGAAVIIRYNNYTEYLLQILLNEWLETFPQTSGIIIRTGETYTFDTPYHTGSSPIAEYTNINNKREQNNIWVQYIHLLRSIVCVQYHTKVIFRTWFSITDVATYDAVTQQIIPHSLLYFSIKHTAGDFFRQMSFNPILLLSTDSGGNNHSQIIEIQIQREYEGKGAYPIYLFEHIVFGDPSSGSNHSLSQLFPNGCSNNHNNATAPNIIQGLWTWSRGGGWWGPYIHANEFWIDLNINMFVTWWNEDHCNTTSDSTTSSNRNILHLFQKVCTSTLLSSQTSSPYATFVSQNITKLSSLNNACTALRQILLLADQALLHGRYCPEVKTEYSNCWIWTRDDRIGGLNELRAHMDYLRGNDTRISESLNYKQQSIVLWKHATTLYYTNVSSTFATINPNVDRQIRNSFLYAQSYFCIIESAWRVLIYGTITYNSHTLNQTLLQNAIFDYDACWNMYRAIGLITPEFPSLYKGVAWNFPHEPESEGMDATINRLRSLLRLNNEQNVASSQ